MAIVIALNFQNCKIQMNDAQVEYLFTDKTGTLTENEMKFRQCSVGGIVYEDVNDQLCVKPSIPRIIPTPLVSLTVSYNLSFKCNVIHFVYCDRPLLLRYIFKYFQPVDNTEMAKSGYTFNILNVWQNVIGERLASYLNMPAVVVTNSQSQTNQTTFLYYQA